MRYPTDAANRWLSVFTVFCLFSGGFWPALLGRWGALVLLAALTAGVAVVMTRRRLWARLPLRRFPRTLLLLALVLVLSISWSPWPGSTALSLLLLAVLTLLGLYLTTALSWPGILTALGIALTRILALSLILEFVAAVFVRQPIFTYGAVWNEAALFRGGPIQGIVGDAGVLAFLAVLTAIVVGVQLAQGLTRTRPAVAWLIVAALVLALTRSLPALIALAAAALLAGALLLGRRLGTGRRLWVLAGIAALTLAVVITLMATRSMPLSSLWPALATESGPVAVVLLVLFLVGTGYRTWWLAVDPPLDRTGARLPLVATTLAPALLLGALVAESAVGDQLLGPIGWVLLIVVGVKTKLELTDVDLPLTTPVAREHAVAP
ncbi:hypothetical protein [Herbiconiux solani]|uniref:hypothetical protein n=1 Tax=Herbiconiux solani TaxID=661329 RepID=UPI000825C5D5|nr:hypothetical protein [Herbiconiux solani]